MAKIFIPKSVIFAVVVFFTAAVDEGVAIHCFECTSVPNSSCGDDFQLNYVQIVNCNDPHGTHHYLPSHEQARWCKKEILKTSDGIVIKRGCLMPSEVRDFPEMDLYNDDEICSMSQFTQVEMCRCHSELCNGSPSVRRNIVFVLPLILMCMFIFS